MRTDIIQTDLWHVQDRIRLDERNNDAINETATNLWFKQNFNINKWFRFDAALRLDYFIFQDRDLMAIDTPNKSGTNYQTLPSYKINLVFTPNKWLQLYINNGTGYHSNDARVVVPQQYHRLPMAFAEEVGASVRLGNRAIFTCALYMIDLTDELTFVQDVAQVADNGSSRRMGVDFSGRVQLAKWLTADVDLNYSDNYLTSQFLGPRAASNYYLPLAPVFTSQGGLTARSRNGIKARIGYRAMSNRPANENYSVAALGYYVMDATIAYEKSRWQVSVTAENILNTEWNEAQFATETQLRAESQPVTELCYTAGTPLSIKLGFSFFF